MSTWIVLKLGGNDLTSEPHWYERGTHESDSPWHAGYQAPQEIGEKFGAGEYLLLGEDNRYQRLTIAARQEFYEVEDPDDAESLVPDGIPEGSHA